MNSIRRLVLTAAALTIGLALLIVVAIAYYWYSGERVVTAAAVAAVAPLVAMLTATGWFVGRRGIGLGRPPHPSTAEEILRWLTMPFLLCWPSMNLIVISVLVEDLFGTPNPGFPPFVTALIALAGSALGVLLCFAWAPRNARRSAQFAAVALCLVALVSFGLTASKSRRPLSFRSQGDNYSMALGALCAVALVRRAGSSGQVTPQSPRNRHGLATPAEPRS